MSIKWTQQEYNLLKQLNAIGLSTASELAQLLGIKREHLDIYLVTNPTFKGYPIAEK